jgi:hypothetical protein
MKLQGAVLILVNKDRNVEGKTNVSVTGEYSVPFTTCLTKNCFPTTHNTVPLPILN